MGESFDWLMSVARLVGDGIEKAVNARAMLDAAAMFGLPCLFHDTQGLSELWRSEESGELDTVDDERLLRDLLPLIAVENGAASEAVYAATLPSGASSLVVGNERRGINPKTLRAAAKCVEIPMASRRINTLNVASAAAVTLFYVVGGHRRAMRHRGNPDARRPALWLHAPTDHVECGSTIRSAAGFGWRLVGLDDANGVWFGTARPSRTEGRAAARSHRNATRVMPVPVTDLTGFTRVVVASVHADGRPIQSVDLAGGRDTILVIPDESQGKATEVLDSLPGATVARVEVPMRSFPYRFRLVSSIVLAEAARQVGRGPERKGRAPRRGLVYESVLAAAAAPEAGEWVTREELEAY